MRLPGIVVPAARLVRREGTGSKGKIEQRAAIFAGEAGVADAPGGGLELGAQPRALLRCGLAGAAADEAIERAKERLRLGDRVAELLRAAAADEAVGVLAGGQLDEGERALRPDEREGELDDALGRARAGGVTVEADHRRRGMAPKEVELLLGERGAERGDGGGESGLVERDHVHVALDDQRRARAEVVAGAVDAVKRAALGENLGLRAVDIFRLAVAENPAAGTDDLAASDRGSGT